MNSTGFDPVVSPRGAIPLSRPMRRTSSPPPSVGAQWPRGGLSMLAEGGMARAMGQDTMSMQPQNAVPDYLRNTLFQRFDGGGQVDPLGQEQAMAEARAKIVPDIMANIYPAVYGAARNYATAPLRWGPSIGLGIADAVRHPDMDKPSWMDALPSADQWDNTVDSSIPGALKDNRAYDMGRNVGDITKGATYLKPAVAHSGAIRRALQKFLTRPAIAAGTASPIASEFKDPE